MAAEGISPFDAWFDSQAGWYEGAAVDVGINGRISHLFPGQKLNFHANTHPNNNYRDYALHLLREIARCIGVTYESATGDYTGATYSSVRMAWSSIWPMVLVRRAFILTPFCQPVYEAWLEEEIARGGIPFPGGLDAFLANRTAASRAKWLGAPRPQADDLKTAKAHQVWRDMGVITDEQIASDLGHDIEDVYQQRAAEMEMRGLYGLPETAIVSGMDGDPDGGAAEDDQA